MKPILELEDLHFRYPGQSSPALRGASLSVPSGCKAAVVGPNGSGKSTLFLHCNGILRPDSGIVRFAGCAVAYDRGSLLELRREVGLVFPDPEDQLFSASVAQDISFGPLNLGMNEVEAWSRVQWAADLCGLTELLDRPTHALSSGEKARAALAGVLAMDPRILLVDEVTGNLDPAMRRQALRLFERLAGAGKTVLLATHDMEIARRWADLVVAMEAGRVVAVAPPEEVFGDRALVEQLSLADPW